MHGNALPDRNAVRRFVRQGRNLSHEFVARDDRRLGDRYVAIEDVCIRSTDACQADVNQGFARRGLRITDLTHGEVPPILEYRSLHRMFLFAQPRPAAFRPVPAGTMHDLAISFRSRRLKINLFKAPSTEFLDQPNAVVGSSLEMAGAPAIDALEGGHVIVVTPPQRLP